MAMHQHKKPTKEQFHAYQDVQQSGVTNMWAVDTVIDLASIELTQGNCFYIMKNYADLEKEYGDGRKS